MGSRALAISVVCLLGCAVLSAADFWEEKDFTAWSDKDVEKMMTNSPWAKRVTVVFPRPPTESGGRGGGRGGRGGGFGGGSPQARLIVRWQSALPVRQAAVRAQIGSDGAVGPEAQAVLDQNAPGYFVVVSGVPGQFGRLSSEALMVDARLERKGAEPIRPVQAAAQREGRGVALAYVFPKDDAIVLADKDVEFVTKVGDTTIKRKFKLEDMVYNDQLEL
ncbi:MAG: hypothetical protein QGI10_15125 [Vicinamibacterales bacterium]|jgi:hypothetical protein|nr:hypothetical protein [Vicinamibacterales bacterium]MDP7480593.1 hypothetical protein [Vicinamibacterales bacterium]MDP7690508.1 hypothetical protein [Vicinamibacterales bacterium]HJN42906.1 hypothetical protein [Vicinamibacterales bacterium]|tara:strand:+ start:398 stop:1057 length:660 start_codon:yes stop_codon:yes gene_type:complete